MEETEAKWETLVDHEDYEIWTDFPFQIRKKKNQRIIKECLNKTSGYVLCHLNRKTFKKHRLIAIQFIPNPNQLPQIDHKNGIRNDNRIENLRFVSRSDNMLNVKSNRGIQFEYFNDLPVPCQSFDFYNGHEFEGFSIDEEKNIFFHNGLMFRKLQVLLMKNRYPYYKMTDIEGKQVCVYLNKID
jgi:hypothetical protein